MRKAKLSLQPQEITKTMWYYEEKKGIKVIYEIYVNGVYNRTDQFVIPWKKICASVKRFYGA